MKVKIKYLTCERCGKIVVNTGGVSEQVKNEFIENKNHSLCETCVTSEEKYQIDMRTIQLIMDKNKGTKYEI